MGNDDARGNEAPIDPEFDPTYATSGPRRSTFTPPPASQRNVPTADTASVSESPSPSPSPSANGSDASADAATHDDDELARAMAQDFSRVAPPTGPISIPNSGLDPNASLTVPPPSPQRGTAPIAPPPGSIAAPRQYFDSPPPSSPSTPQSWGESERVGEPAQNPTPPTTVVPQSVEPSTRAVPESPRQSPPAPPLAEPTLAEPALAEPALADRAVPEPARSRFAPTPTGDTTAPAVQPWLSAPAPDPTQAVELEAIPVARPIRRSLLDDQLQDLVDGAAAQPGSTLNVIEELEAQLQLREADARQFTAWETSMLALGTPDAIAALEEVRSEFSGVASVVPPLTSEAPPNPPEPPLESPEEAAMREFLLSGVAREPNTATEPSDVRDARDVRDVREVWEVEEPIVLLSPPEPPALVEPPPFGLIADSVLPVPAEPALGAPVNDEPLGGAPGFGSAADAGFPYRGGGVGLDPIEPSEEIAPMEFDDIPHQAGAQPADTPSWVAAPSPVDPPPTPFSFEDLLAGRPDGEGTREPTSATPEGVFIVPMALAAGEPEPTDTDSIRIIEPSVEAELDDEVDETDRAFPGLMAAGTAAESMAFAAQQASPPSAPIPITRVPVDEVVLAVNEPVKQKVFSLELSGLEPTPVEQRVGRSARLFWLWFAANSSILSLALGATVFGLGMSLRQAIVGIFAGIALSFLPLGLTTLAGKRSGQPTMVVSRATFGVVGNVIPAIFALVTRVFWGAVLLWLLATATVIVLVGAEVDGGLGEGLILIIALGAGLIAAALVAVVGYTLFARIQLVLSVVTALLLIGLVVLTASYINVQEALTTPDGPWILSVTAAVLVFSFVGLAWANSGADLARYQRPGSSGGGSMLLATFGATLPSFVIIGYGALLAASNEGIARGLATSPLDTLALILPSWYPVPLLAAAGLSLLSGVTITLYSGGFAFQAIGVRMSRQTGVLTAALLVAAVAALISFGIAGGVAELFRDLATTLAVPTAAWAGIFAAEMMIRKRGFESESLLARGGVYPNVQWVNLIGLLLISGIGLGLTSATVSWLGWQGYLFGPLGVPIGSDLAATDLGVLIALGLGLLVPILFGIPGIRRQEKARV
jgi:purine-cytosine permease-like protein